MKTKFTLKTKLFYDPPDPEDKRIIKYYRHQGFTVNMKDEEIYRFYDYEIKLNIGDRISLSGFQLVEWKCFYLEEDYIEYILVEE